jgi:hypothetical protein
MSGLIAAVRTAFAQKVEDLTDAELDERLRANGQGVSAMDAERGALPRDADNQSRWRIGEKLARLEEERTILNRERTRRYLHPAVVERQETAEQRKTRETLEAVQVEPEACDDPLVARMKAHKSYLDYAAALEALNKAQREQASQDRQAPLWRQVMSAEGVWQRWSQRLEVLQCAPSS